jgi:hypothetical protein
MSLYTLTLARLNGLFREPDGRVNSDIIKSVLTSAARQFLTAFQAGAPGSSAAVLTFVAPVAMTFKAGLPDSAAEAGTGATAETIFNIATDGGATWGTITFAIAGTTGVFAAAAETEVAAGSLVTITAPASADVSLANIAFSLVGMA